MTVKLAAMETRAESLERITYLKEMLAELTQVARAEKADMLVYLLEMAFTEANDVIGRLVLQSTFNRH